MTKIEKLKAAYEAVPPDDWERLATAGELHVCTISENGCDVASVCDVFKNDDVGEFITLAHNLMPQLLEAVELLKGVGDVRDMAELMNLWDHKIEPVLEKLK